MITALSQHDKRNFVKTRNHELIRNCTSCLRSSLHIYQILIRSSEIPHQDNLISSIRKNATSSDKYDDLVGRAITL
ncbi:hypothetical protein Mapa_011583 [Marchantia paleacea]|nr:hypothetical protein Mapa_011583 [Marchantia paleacea]